jgi:hypothetical protein
MTPGQMNKKTTHITHNNAISTNILGIPDIDSNTLRGWRKEVVGLIAS